MSASRAEQPTVRASFHLGGYLSPAAACMNQNLYHRSPEFRSSSQITLESVSNRTPKTSSCSAARILLSSLSVQLVEYIRQGQKGSSNYSLASVMANALDFYLLEVDPKIAGSSPALGFGLFALFCYQTTRKIPLKMMDDSGWDSSACFAPQNGPVLSVLS